MAISYVGGKTAVFAGTTSNTNISLTDLTGGSDSSPSQNDIVIVAFGASTTADEAIGVTTSGYTEEQELYSNSPGLDANLSVSWKIMGGTPDTSVDVSGTGHVDNAGAVAIHVWRGVSTSTPFDVAETTATGTGTDRPDPAAITPTTAGSVVIACGAGACFTAANFTTSDLSNFVTNASADANDCDIGMGSFAWTSGAFNPAQFGGGAGANANRSWAAVTLALRPGSNNYTLTASGGSYALTGTATGLKRGYTLAAAGGSYALTGTSIGLRRGYFLAALSGSYALTGLDVSFRKALHLVASIGNYSLSGAAAALKRGYTLAASSGAYSLTGIDAGFRRGYNLVASGGSYVLTGVAAAIRRNINMIAGSGSYTINGTDIQFQSSQGTRARSRRHQRRRRYGFSDYGTVFLGNKYK